MCSCRKEEYDQILEGTKETQITAWWDKAADIIPLNCGKGNAVNAVLEPWNIAASLFAALFVLALTWATTYFGPSRLRRPLPR